MKTITLLEPGKFEATETEAPQTLKRGEALVRIHQVGICGTDLHAFRGKQPFFTYPRILGHELGVEVVEVSERGNEGIKVGDRCAVEPYLNCGHCFPCRRGKSNCCESLKVLGVHTDGGMREFITVPCCKLHRSSKLSYDQLALVETLGIGYHAVNRSRLDTDEWALVVGAGPIGLGVMQFAKREGAKVIALDINAQRLEFCKKQIGVDETVIADGSAMSKIREITNGDMPVVVFDATGNATSMQNSFNFPANSGRLVFVGLVQDSLTLNDPDFHRRELTLLATRNSAPSDFRHVIRNLESGAIDASPWITHRVEASQMIEQFPGWLDPANGVIKAVVSF